MAALLRNQVYVTVITPIRDGMKRHGLSFTELCDGLIDVEHFDNPKNVLDWDLFVQLLERYEQMAGGPKEIARHAEDGPSLPANAWFRRLVEYVADSQQIYWGVVHILGPRYFRRVSFHYTQLDERRIRIKIRIPPDLRGCPQFFQIWIGAWRATPRVLSQPDAFVEAQITPRRAIYTITCPPSTTLLSRARRAWKILFAARGAIEQLSVQEQEIRAEYEERLRAQQALTEQEVRLQLASQLAGLAKMSAIGEMTSGIAHEINNPLAVIHLRAALLHEQLDSGRAEPADLKSHARVIRETSMRIAAIIKGLRAYSRDAQGDPCEVRQVSRIIDETLTLCEEMLKSRQISLEVKVEPRDLALECRPVQISQALLNLLSNSLDAIRDQPERWIRIEARKRDSSVEISVTDSGEGIPTGDREKIFQPFFTTKPPGQGTGLGLSISRGLIESHGGSIGYEPKNGKTRFVIALPQGRLMPGLRVAPKKRTSARKSQRRQSRVI